MLDFIYWAQKVLEAHDYQKSAWQASSALLYVCFHFNLGCFLCSSPVPGQALAVGFR